TQPVLNLNTVEASFTLSLSAPATQVVTVQYALAPGATNPAVPGEDYVDTPGELAFAPGQVSQTIKVLVLSDPSAGVDETFAVNLTNPTNASLATSQGIGTIVEVGSASHTDIWTGLSASSGGSANWSDAGNWSLGHVPGALDTADFTAGSSFTTSTI